MKNQGNNMEQTTHKMTLFERYKATPAKKITLGFSIINSGMAFGISGGYLLSGKLVLENGEHWSKPFLVMSIPTIIVGILFMVLLKEKVNRREDQHKQTGTSTENSTQIKNKPKVSMKDIFTNRNLVCAFILCFCSIYANFVILTWLPQFLQTEGGFEGTSVGFIASLVPWASIPGVLIFAYFSDKFKVTKKLVFFLVPLALISTFGIAFITDKTWLIVMLIVYGLTEELALDPIIITFITKNASRQALSTRLSAYNFICMSSSIYYRLDCGSDQLGSI